MIYSPHTLELSLTLDTKKFNTQLSEAYKKAKKKHRLYEENNVYKDNALHSKGIKIEYHDNIYKKRIKLIVNPSRVLDGDDLKLWKPNIGNISKLIRRLEKYIDDYFDSEYELDDFKLTRIDFTVNIDVGNQKNVSAYIKVLNNIGKVKGFSPKYGKTDIDDYKERSFDLEGNSNGVEFSAYDKEAQLKQKKTENERVEVAKGILRIEVRLTTQKAVHKCTNESSTSKQIKDLSKKSEEIFFNTFAWVVPYGDYFKKKEAVKIIEDNIYKKKQKEKMIKLLELVPKKKSLLLAQKELNDRKIDKVMAAFAELGLSPVTLSKRHNINSLKSLYSFM